MTDRDRLIELLKPHVSGTACLCESGSCELTSCRDCKARRLADHLLANGVIVPPKKEKKMVYFPFPIECEDCSKVIADIGVCKELDLLYAGKHQKYSKEQDWEFMCENCPQGVSEREYEESDEKHIGKTVFLTKEEAETKLKELNKDGNS